MTDLGNVVLLLALINAHCHLDYTTWAGRLRPPKTFPDWIKSILAGKVGMGFLRLRRLLALSGASQLLESGTTTVANIESVPELLTDCRAATPLQGPFLHRNDGVRSGRNLRP